ncbi:calcium release-activated calcium channel protein 1 [Nomia melanderi]|uniref:calcium release-activated calcium channel protein 1 n=1 Tax=Nomia melanderi TaxID=2448451 RepID=UPI00130413CB|nr:calcium release-activated calcium channel protein 1-like [Nomia melanderi]
MYKRYRNDNMSNDNLVEKDTLKQNNTSNQDDRTMNEKHGRRSTICRYRSSEEIIGKADKFTQIDFVQLPQSTQRTRPASSYLSRQFQLGDTNYSYYNSRSTLCASQSELVLSPRNRTNRYVALDMRSMGSLPFSSQHANSHISGSNIPYTCCCTCAGPQVPPTPSSPPVEEHDGPEGLSWRRLHMSRAKLKATATTSELLSGFAMVAMVELQINDPNQVPEWLFVMFAVCTTVLVSVHIFALMISTYLLPNIEAISKLQVSRLVTESPHERMRGFIELAWAFSTVLGLFLFLVEVAILCWVKFWDYSFTAATASTIIVIPVLIVFIAFAVHFYHSLVVYKCESSVTDMNELESIKRNLDNVTMGQSSV